MTKVIGLTGGIGSGKSTLAQYIASQGIPVYIADLRARELLQTPKVLHQIADAFGPDVLTDGVVDRQKLAAVVFRDKDSLQRLNGIVHPAVDEDFREWLRQHADSDIVVKEAAILFETGSYKKLDAVINVAAPIEVRIDRVTSRDQVTREQVLDRMQNQFSDEKRAELADITIQNINISEAKRQIDEFLKKMRNL